MMQPPAPTIALFDVEAFETCCSALDAHHLPECARQALSRHGTSPRELTVATNDALHETTVRFARPDERVTRTFQRTEFVEKGAVCLACLAVPSVCGLRVTRVTERGSNADYFLADESGREVAVLEVGGTDEGRLDALAAEKLAQVGGSPWRRKPFLFSGYAAVVRFANVASMRVARYEVPSRKEP